MNTFENLLSKDLSTLYWYMYDDAKSKSKSNLVAIFLALNSLHMHPQAPDVLEYMHLGGIKKVVSILSESP